MIYWDDPADGASVFTTNLMHTGAISGLEVDDISGTVITSGMDGSIRTWTLDGNPLQTFPGIAESIIASVHLAQIQSVWCCVAKHGRFGSIRSLDTLVGEDNSWQLERLSRLGEVRAERLFDGNTSGQDSDWVFGTTVDKELVIWRMNKFCPLRAYKSPREDRVECLIVIDPVGQGNGTEFIATGTAEGMLMLWHRNIEKFEDSWIVIAELKGGHRGPVVALAFCHSAGALLSGGYAPTHAPAIAQSYYPPTHPPTHVARPHAPTPCPRAHTPCTLPPAPQQYLRYTYIYLRYIKRY